MFLKIFLIVWIVALSACFILSIIILTLVQTRVSRKDGLRAFREKRMLDTYWKDLSVMERALLWPGIIMFFLTLFGATAWNLIMSRY